MTDDEWANGPQAHCHLLPFVALNDVLPSRFVLAYDGLHRGEIAFLALDAEKLGKIANDGAFTDLGDNQLVTHVSAMRKLLATPF